MYKIMIESINNTYKGIDGAIDIHTGLDCNTGKAYEAALKADFTVTLTALKQGFLDPRSLEYTGEVILETLAVNDCFKEAGLFEYVGEEYAKAH